jgi:hypothetical protein
MTNWQPHVDLARLLEALAEEIVAATEPEIHQGCADGGHSVRAAAGETRRIIGAATGDLGDPHGRIALVEPTLRDDFVYKQH